MIGGVEQTCPVKDRATIGSSLRACLRRFAWIEATAPFLAIRFHGIYFLDCNTRFLQVRLHLTQLIKVYLEQECIHALGELKLQ